MRKLKQWGRRYREAKMFVKAMASPHHPILAQIIPIRRCNLACTYCNEYDNFSPPVPTDEMLRRIDTLADFGTGIITFSGGEPTLHPDLDFLIRRVRERGSIATIITNGLLLTPERIQALNRAGLDYLQISIDNAEPDDVSKKSLRVLDRKLQWLEQYADFDVTINSVLGSEVRQPEDAFAIASRARQLRFNSTVGILHDGSGQLHPLSETQSGVYRRIHALGSGLFSFAHHDGFQGNIVKGLANNWHCPAGGRFLYVCEEGLVHYCSQQRGRPGIPLSDYTQADLIREAAKPKGCAPFCTISCVHQTAMVDDFRTKPKQTLGGIIARRKQRDPQWKVPISIKALQFMFVRDSRTRDFFGGALLKVMGLRRHRPVD